MDKENSILPVFKLAMEDVSGADLKASADRLALEYDEGIHLDFLLQSYVVANNGVFKKSGEDASQIISALLIQYCLSNTKSRPTGNFVSVGQLAGPGSGIGSYFTNEYVTQMDKKFSNDIEKLERTALKLGAKKDDDLVSGGVSFIFEPLKHIPVQLLFYPADEEFGAGGSILLDASATDFLGFETLAFLVTLLIRKLTGRDF
ncbi:MAG: DUF3786 domain-containing protein [Desulfobacteraceae bacterium]|nr:DUF3786 domain-containing protein [Desulfobacteraceae bacterium]